MQTNDPSRPWLEVVLTGRVESFAEVRPQRVKLVGAAGTPVAVEVEIIPRADYPFTIKDISAKSGESISYSLTRRCTDGHDRCIVRIENTRGTAGRYGDVISVRTDSSLKPVIPIFIVGLLH
ncbi:MAG: hypothetical protein IH612_21315 [Desulfofustis sp.]|nr:hypothetical protein [Desulfofustis sp.]